MGQTLEPHCLKQSVLGGCYLSLSARHSVLTSVDEAEDLREPDVTSPKRGPALGRKKPWVYVHLYKDNGIISLDSPAPISNPFHLFLYSKEKKNKEAHLHKYQQTQYNGGIYCIACLTCSAATIMNK